ncbi:hypothetical protein H2248_002774 [Termitomyces sp. 'cryptogamus']|nr:hypothetical protein H2248_002774 [Termitomyces sp. 'cryptogamus']
MTPQDEAKKRPQIASPKKQQGVRSHDKKRRNILTNPSMEMEDLGTDAPVGSPISIVPLPIFAESVKEGAWNHDAPPPRTKGSDQAQSDNPPWIIRQSRCTSLVQNQNVSLEPPPSTQPQLQDSVLHMAPQPDLLQTGTQPTPQLLGNIVRSCTLAEGFPVIHLSTPPWYNLLPEQRTHFNNYLEPKLWIQDWQGSYQADLVIIEENPKTLIQQITGVRAKLSSPQKDKDLQSCNRNDHQNPPYHFLVSGITNEAHAILMAHPIISTPKATTFMLPYSPPIPQFLCTLEGFSLSIKDAETIQESKNEATRIVCKALTKNDEFTSLFKSKLVSDNMSQHNLEPIITILSTLEVRLVKGNEAITNKARFWNQKTLVEHIPA